jgi:hypothetical protein
MLNSVFFIVACTLMHSDMPIWDVRVMCVLVAWGSKKRGTKDTNLNSKKKLKGIIKNIHLSCFAAVFKPSYDIFKSCGLWTSRCFKPLPWSPGPLVLWSLGPLVAWSIGLLLPWSSGPLVLWSLGPLIFWTLGPLVPWSSNLLVLWSFRPLVAVVH